MYRFTGNFAGGHIDLAFGSCARQQHILKKARGEKCFRGLGKPRGWRFFARGGMSGMDAETAFSADAIVFPLLIAAFIYFVVIRPLYRRDRDRRRRRDKRRK